MKKTGGWLTAYALEQIGVRYTFGIPGTHTIEIYDELRKSEKIEPFLVTHELGASFMAEALSRTSDTIGCIVIVPSAGATHAMSGIGEAYLDGIPMIIISGGIRRDSGRHYQLHQWDQLQTLSGITKATFLVDRHEDIVTTIYKTYDIATSGLPGPVCVEISADTQMFSAEVSNLPNYGRTYTPPGPTSELLQKALELIKQSKQMGLYLGWGAREATRYSIEIAERLGAPVSTTLQGISVFPADHPLHAGFGFGPSSVPAAQTAFQDVDCLLAVGVRFAEVATASYGMPIPENLIHVDIDPEVFNKNYPATVAIESDAEQFLSALVDALKNEHIDRNSNDLRSLIHRKKESFHKSWTSKINPDKVSPGLFFKELRQQLDRDAYLVVDDGNHTFLAAEQFPVFESKHFISPTDFNCMGYAVPGAIATKLAHPDKQVCAIIGDGAFIMTCMEILTATTNKIGAIFFVFHDCELSQISQFQHLPMKYKTCTVLEDVRFEGVATATGAAYLRIENDLQTGDIITKALRIAQEGVPIIIDINIDYSKQSVFTKGTIQVNLSRFPLRQKMRFIGRALKRHTIG